MSKVQFSVLGYVCYNPKDSKDIRFYSSNEFLGKDSEKKEGYLYLSESIESKDLPIISKDRLAKFNINIAIKNSKDIPNNNPVQDFLGKRALSDEFKDKYPVSVSTSRKVLVEFLRELAFASKNSAPFTNTNRYYSDFKLSKPNNSQPLEVKWDGLWLGDDFENFGLNVEDFLINKNDRETRYKVFSIHVLAHKKSKTHIIYSAEVDGFLHDEKTNTLTPVEIKCVQHNKKKQEVKYLQANLGMVSKIVFAHYEKPDDSCLIVKKFEQQDVSRTFPEYGLDRLLLLSRVFEYNQNFPSLMTIVENGRGDIQKLRFAKLQGDDAKIKVSTILEGNLRNNQSEQNISATTAEDELKPNELEKWIQILGNGDLNSRTCFI